MRDDAKFQDPPRRCASPLPVPPERLLIQFLPLSALLSEMVAKPGTPSIIPQSSYAASLASLSKDPSVPFTPLDLPAPLSVNAGMKAVGMMDLTIMGLCEALERTEEQFRTLLDGAGLEVSRPSFFAKGLGTERVSGN